MKFLDLVLKKVFGKTFSELGKGVFAKEVMSLLGMQVFTLFASIFISIIISNRLGAEAYGTYSYAFSWMNLLAMFSCLGLEQVVLKEIPAYRARGENSLARGLIFFSNKKIWMIAIAASIFVVFVTVVLHLPADTNLRCAIWLALPALAIQSHINLRFNWLRAYHHNLPAQLADKVLRPAFSVFFLLMLAFVFPSMFSADNFIVFNVMALAIALLVLHFISSKKIFELNRAAPKEIDAKRWMNTARALFFVSFCYYFFGQVNLLMLGSLRGAKEAGVFAIASRLCDLEGYLLVALNVMLASVMSKLYAEGKMQELQSLITKGLRFVFILSMPVLICFVIFAKFFLGLFGDEFGEGTTALIIISLSQIVNLATGSVGYLLTMTGHQNTAAKILGSCAMLSLILSFALVKLYGVNGAAYSTAAISIILNVWMSIVVYRKTKINSTIF